MTKAESGFEAWFTTTYMRPPNKPPTYIEEQMCSAFCGAWLASREVTAKRCVKIYESFGVVRWDCKREVEREFL